MSHTKEPWFLLDSLSAGEAIGAYDLAGKPVLIAGVPYGPTISGESNARRIVDCVNACAGIANPAALPELIKAAEVVIEKATANDATACFQSLVQLKNAIAKMKGGA